jgi:hypothetical protein
MMGKLFAEGLGTALLLETVVGSGIMGARLADGNTTIALLGNTIPTGAILVVLISTLGPISGAHFNPLVSLASLVNRSMKPGETAASTSPLPTGSRPRQALPILPSPWRVHFPILSQGSGPKTFWVLFWPNSWVRTSL